MSPFCASVMFWSVVPEEKCNDNCWNFFLPKSPLCLCNVLGMYYARENAKFWDGHQKSGFRRHDWFSQPLFSISNVLWNREFEIIYLQYNFSLILYANSTKFVQKGMGSVLRRKKSSAALKVPSWLFPQSIRFKAALTTKPFTFSTF